MSSSLKRWRSLNLNFTPHLEWSDWADPRIRKIPQEHTLRLRNIECLLDMIAKLQDEMKDLRKRVENLEAEAE